MEKGGGCWVMRREEGLEIGGRKEGGGVCTV
jgi:hypothetical protein